MDLKEIIKYCQKENQVAQGLLFDIFYNPMHHLSMRMVNNSHDVEDILSTVFIKVFKNIQKFNYQGDASLNKWIKTITINESIRFLKKRKTLVFNETIEDIEADIAEEPFDNSALNIKKVYAIIESMPEGYRMVFNLYAIEEYSHKEIAEFLNISINTSKSQLRKARKFIVEKINKTDAYECA